MAQTVLTFNFIDQRNYLESREMHNPEKKIIRLLKLFTGILIISGLISILGWVKLPGGTLSATIRHNIEEDIDATPIFYGDVENMGELEAGLQELIENSPNR